MKIRLNEGESLDAVKKNLAQAGYKVNDHKEVTQKAGGFSSHEFGCQWI